MSKALKPLNTQGPVRPAPSLRQLSDSCVDCVLLVCNKERVNEVSSVGVLRSAPSLILVIALKALLPRAVSSQHASTQHRIARVDFCSTMGPPGHGQGLHGPVPSSHDTSKLNRKDSNHNTITSLLQSAAKYRL